MIVVTGGAGFIGSALVWALNRRGEDDILIVDQLHETEKWKNLVGLRFSDYLDKTVFIDQLTRGHFGDQIRAVLHMGACSATTEKDADYLMENNYRYTARIAAWRETQPRCRLIYASSAATYGDGARGYGDAEADLPHLYPLNMYGYSKHLFDLLALRQGWLKHIVGLKYFNVFGPNEYHKDDMRSVINKAYPQVRDEGRMRLFKSHRADYKDGEQLRDFIYVKDAVNMTLFFLENPDIGGIYNIGTGRAQSWNDVAAALFKAAEKPLNVEYIPMPDHLQGKYQYYTCADLTKLQAAGWSQPCRPLEDAIEDYVCHYLSSDAYLAFGLTASADASPAAAR